MKLPSLQVAISSYEEKKQEVESVKNELASFSRIGLTSEQRRRRNYLEVLLRTIKNELCSAELTLAEIQWYGEGETA